MSISAFTTALNGLEKGTISLEGLTSTVIKAVSSLTSLEDSLSRSEKAIKKF
jgi:hypothetical protein